jgi:hypothetical protein
MTSQKEHLPSPEIETPEQAGLRKQLDEAREYFEQGQLREALALSAQIKSRAEAPEVKEAAADLRDRAQHELNTRMDSALADGDADRAAGDDAAARKHYRAVQELDPENTHARRALIEIDGVIRERLSQADAQRLCVSLKEKRDIKRLGEAVYLAEAWDEEGKLSEELVSLLKEARHYYDDLRTQMGQEATMARHGDLESVKAAWEKARERLAQGYLYMYHSVMNKDVPTVEYVEEINRLFEERSAEAVQYETEIITRSLPAHPGVAKQRLISALEKPFHEHHRRVLEEKLQEVEALIYEQREAETLLEQAGTSDDPLEILGMVLQAYEVFPYISGMSARLAQARQTALDPLVAQMDAHYRKAGVLLKTDTHEAYEQVRAEIANSAQVAARWPEAERPPKLVDLLEAGEGWAEKTNARQALRNEFERRIKAIRQQVSDPSRREAGRQLYRELREDEDFAGFTELRTLIYEIAQLSENSERLAEAQAAKTKGDWQHVYKLTEKMKTEGKAGQLAPEVDVLFAEAVLELDIVRAQQRLQNKDVIEANSILSYIIKKAPTKARREELNERLKPDLEHIQQCIANTRPMQKLFDQALGMVGLLDSAFVMAFLVHALDRSQSAESISGLTQPDYERIEKTVKRKKNDPLSIQGAADGARILLLDELKKKAADDRVRALRLFRYVQGDASGNPEEDWEPYRLSLRTTDAGKMARLLTESLRQDVLEPLQTAYGQREEREFDESQVRIMAARAYQLREATLLESESEREAARWFEVKQGRRAAAVREELEDWDGAVAIWQELDLHHYGEKIVQESLHRAQRKQAAIQPTLTNTDDLEKLGDWNNVWQIALNQAHLHATLGLAYLENTLSGLAQAEHNKDARSAARQERDKLSYELERLLARLRDEGSHRI